MPISFASPTYAIDGTAWVGNAVDDDGCRWTVEKQTILSGPTMKTRIVGKPAFAGGYRRKSYQDVERRWLRGVCIAPDRLARERAEDWLRGLLSDGEQHELVVTSPWLTRKAMCEQDGELKIEQEPNGYTFRYLMNLAFADPRWLSPLEPHGGVLQPPVIGTGLAWGSGLVWGSGLSWGTPSTTGTMTLTNGGSGTEYPVVRLDGPLAAGATVRLVETGQVHTFGPALASGDYLLIDNKNHTVLFNGTIDRFSSMVAAQWFEIPKRSSITLALAASGTGTLSATWYDASTM